MLDDLLDQFDQLLDPQGPDPASQGALATIDSAPAILGDPGGALAHLDVPGHLDALVLPPGSDLHAHHLSLADPLTGMQTYGFEGFTLHPDHGLVDTDGDGVFDRTCWGTDVIQVDPYVRADGTVVEGHYRTVPDGARWNNLRP